MKVGTDGTLLGAWARGGQRILDIGTGTGLIALMMAQRFPEAQVVGIDIDAEAVGQACENVAASPFQNIDIIEADARTFNVPLGFAAWLCQERSTFNVILSNPPYFEDSLECPDNQRTMARHTSSLSYRDLMESAWRLLADDGELSVVIPFDCKARLESEAVLKGFFKSRECAVKTTPKKQPRRYLMAFRKHPTDLELSEGIIETAPNVRSEWYQELTKDFYL
jgi:tRNA1Val (adenine37-N6)-methyltransferase